MIIFKPETDKNILGEHNCTDIFYAYENDEKVGEAYMNIAPLFCDVFYLEYAPDKLYVGQGLLRSCYNAAANAGAYMGKLTAKGCEKVALSMNFIFDGTAYMNDIPTILMGTCGDLEI